MSSMQQVLLLNSSLSGKLLVHAEAGPAAQLVAETEWALQDTCNK
jgi:hypothetical protein